MVTLTDKVRMLFDSKNFAVLSTLEPDGKPHSVWTKRDADDILFALPKEPPQDRQLEPGPAGDRRDPRCC
jgi:hypothetical protein